MGIFNSGSVSGMENFGVQSGTDESIGLIPTDAYTAGAGSGGVGSSGSGSSGDSDETSKAYADMLREQWDDYLTRIMPYATQLKGMTSYAYEGEDKTSWVEGQLADAKNYTIKGLSAANKAYDEGLRSYGVIPSDDQAKATELQRQLALTSELAGAANTIRANIIERDRKIATGYGGTTTTTTTT